MQTIQDKVQVALNEFKALGIYPEYAQSWDFMRSWVKKNTSAQHLVDYIKHVNAYAKVAELVDGLVSLRNGQIVLELGNMFTNQDLNDDRRAKLKQTLKTTLDAINSPNFVDFYVKELSIVDDIKTLLRAKITIVPDSVPKIIDGYLITQLTYQYYKKQEMRNLLVEFGSLGVVCASYYMDIYKGDYTLYLATPIPNMRNQSIPLTLADLSVTPRSTKAKPSKVKPKHKHADLERIMSELEDGLFDGNVSSTITDKFYELKGLLLELNQL